MNEALRAVLVFGGLAGFVGSGGVFLWSTRFLTLETFEKHFTIGRWCMVGLVAFSVLTLMGLAG